MWQPLKDNLKQIPESQPLDPRHNQRCEKYRREIANLSQMMLQKIEILEELEQSAPVRRITTIVDWIEDRPIYRQIVVKPENQSAIQKSVRQDCRRREKRRRKIEIDRCRKEL